MAVPENPEENSEEKLKPINEQKSFVDRFAKRSKSVQNSYRVRHRRKVKNHRIRSASASKTMKLKRKRYYLKRAPKLIKMKTEEKVQNPHIPEDIFMSKRDYKKFKKEKIDTQNMSLLYKDKFWERREWLLQNKGNDCSICMPKTVQKVKKNFLFFLG